MIVVDTNVVCYFFLPGTNTANAEQLFHRDPQWSAPLLWRSEFRNVLAGYLRLRNLSLDTARQLMTAAETLFSGSEYPVFSNHVLELAEKSGCSAYDCEFIALAQDLDIPLITTDKKLAKSFPQNARLLNEFLD